MNALSQLRNSTSAIAALLPGVVASPLLSKGARELIEEMAGALESAAIAITDLSDDVAILKIKNSL